MGRVGVFLMHEISSLEAAQCRGLLVWHRQLRLTQQMAQPVLCGCSNVATLL